MNNILVYCGVKFAEKDYAKLNGAKWDNKIKAWYFPFNLSDLIENENISTHNYKPYKIDFSQCEEYNLKDKKEQYELTTKVFEILTERNNKNIVKATNELYVLKRN